MLGGSETRPTCRNSMVKMEKKNMAGEVVKMERMEVKVMVMASNGHRRSETQEEGIPEMKVKDLGNEASKEVLSIPLRRVPG